MPVIITTKKKIVTDTIIGKNSNNNWTFINSNGNFDFCL